MRKFRAAVLAGAVLAATAGTAMAAEQGSHFLNVALPDGSVARIEYKGDVAPRVVVAPVRQATPIAFFDPFFEPASFAMFDRIAAEMDRQAAAMMRQASALEAQPMAVADGKIDAASFRNMPAGTVSYSFVSTSSGGATCSRSVRVTSLGANEQPKVVSNSSGDCSAMTRKPQPVAQNAKSQAPAVTTVSLPAASAAKAAPSDDKTI
ncbi:MAG TPA: hypothetical protein VNZ43_14765 [Sphingomonadaceae bacterium]|jgi:hypothetical protein|nr:hypothetical protein [Sphingomonadaceae bacterium]